MYAMDQHFEGNPGGSALSFCHVDSGIKLRISGLHSNCFYLPSRLSGSCILCFVCLLFPDRVSLCRLGYPGIHYVDKASFDLRDPAASVSGVLALKACTTTTQKHTVLIELISSLPWPPWLTQFIPLGKGKWLASCSAKMPSQASLFNSGLHLFVCFFVFNFEGRGYS